jgi:hypothetical protein
MKKMLFFAAIAATVLATGCTNENSSQTAENDANAINFRGVVDKATRATAIGSTSELTNFFVQAGQHAADAAIADLNFMSASVYDATPASATATWTYGPLKYFPTNGDKVNFYAYVPVKDVNMTTDMAIVSETAQFGYTVPADQKADNTAVDLLVASSLDQVAPESPTPVALTFNHALSAVTFSAANRNAATGAGSELTYVISDIKITKMDNIGTFDYPFATTSWTAAGTRGINYVAGLPEAGVALEAIGADADAQKLLSANDMMMVLPQTVTAGTLDTDGVTPLVDETFVEVTYSLKDGAGVPIFSDKVRQLTLPADFEFVAGQRYNFAFDFSASDAISFTVTEVVEWDDQDATELPQ